MNFKIGQRVRVIAVSGEFHFLVGAVGVVVEYARDGRTPIINIDEHRSPHASGLWKATEGSIEPIDDDPPALGSWHALRKIWQPRGVRA